MPVRRASGNRKEPSRLRMVRCHTHPKPAEHQRLEIHSGSCNRVPKIRHNIPLPDRSWARIPKVLFHRLLALLSPPFGFLWRTTITFWRTTHLSVSFIAGLVGVLLEIAAAVRSSPASGMRPAEAGPRRKLQEPARRSHRFAELRRYRPP